MKCKFKDNVECDKRSINDKICAYCLSIMNAEIMDDMEKRLDALEHPTPAKKVTGRKPKAKMIG